MKKLFASALVFIVICTAFAGCGANKGDGNPKVEGKIDAKIILVLEDESEVPYDINVTDGSTVREALIEAKLIGEEAESAFFIEDIDGHSAKAEDGVLWNVCDEDGNPIGSVDDVTLSAGKTIKMVYTAAPNFDD